MVSGIYVPADADQPLEQREFATFDDLAAAVDGWTTTVDLLDLGVTIYVNEEGLLRHLPFNSRASFLWWYHVPRTRQQAMLVGNAVLVGLPGRDGKDTDLPDAVRELLLAPVAYGVEVCRGVDSKWHTSPVTYPDYWEAIIWAMVLLERLDDVEEVRVVPVDPEGAEQRTT
ncbi:DUF3846 domain-containing protein [Agrococcus sp. Ld7]|uniref:DUF3846 domain-containing protein n=1 Tax=Agrococcus sp. Ld7 TaxID=649148 RepID=UPI00386F12B2